MLSLMGGECNRKCCRQSLTCLEKAVTCLAHRSYHRTSSLRVCTFAGGVPWVHCSCCLQCSQRGWPGQAQHGALGVKCYIIRSKGSVLSFAVRRRQDREFRSVSECIPAISEKSPAMLQKKSSRMNIAFCGPRNTFSVCRSQTTLSSVCPRLLRDNLCAELSEVDDATLYSVSHVIRRG